MKIRVITTANDVIHAWMVPSFGIQQAAIPGFVRDTWFRAEKVGGLLRSMCAAVRQGTFLHADSREGRFCRRLLPVGGGREEKLAAKADDPTKVWDRAGDHPAWRKSLCRQLCRLSPGQWQRRRHLKPLDGSAVVQDADKGVQLAVVLNGRTVALTQWSDQCDAVLEAAQRPTLRRSSRSPRTTGPTRTGQLVQPADVTAARR